MSLEQFKKPFVSEEALQWLRKEYSLDDYKINQIPAQLNKIRGLNDFMSRWSPYLTNKTKDEFSYVLYRGYENCCKRFYPFVEGTDINTLSEFNFTLMTNAIYYILVYDFSRTSEEVNYRLSLVNFIRDAARNINLPEMRRAHILDIAIHVARNSEERDEITELLNEMRGGIRRGNNEHFDRFQIATDSQNVHDNVLNAIYRRKLIVLEKDSIPFETFDQTVNKYISERKSIEKDSIGTKVKRIVKNIFNLDEDDLDKDIKQALQLISTNPIVFSPTKLTLKEIFQRIFYRVKKLKDKDYYPDVLKRIDDELKGCLGYCSTGYCTRIVNILSGYPEIDIEVITFYIEEIEKKLRELFNDSILSSSEKDELEDSYISYTPEERKKFIEYCKIRKEEWILRLSAEYIKVKNTHCENLFKADFDEAWKKFLAEE